MIFLAAVARERHSPSVAGTLATTGGTTDTGFTTSGGSNHPRVVAKTEATKLRTPRVEMSTKEPDSVACASGRLGFSSTGSPKNN